jgi:micrococcal nuclease
MAGAGPAGRRWRRPLVALGAAALIVSASCGIASTDTSDEAAVERTESTRETTRTTERTGTTRPRPTTTAAPTTTTADPAPAIPDGRRATIVRVVDGDTLVVDGDERVRLIGINTPETKDPRRPVECFGREASAAAEALLPPGTEVVLEADVEATDRYGRTLAYVRRLPDGLFVNLDLVARGFAEVATYPPNVRYVDDLVAAQRLARAESRGLWSACGEVGTPAEAPLAGTCHPSYPTLCLPASPDLDCGDIPERRFPVLPPDPHRLDGDGDGIGCES